MHRSIAAERDDAVVIEVRGLEKSFRVPEHRIDTLKERATHPFRRMEYRELGALRDVSFDVHRGEFFGIVGQNGSGKSTLLKVLASIYRLDAVLEFAELEDFSELKLKNYSSGMLVRLAFAVMVQADADIMLVDEVLAVGDMAFAQKCLDVFHEKRDAGKTIVLVTHDMGAMQSLCHR